MTFLDKFSVFSLAVCTKGLYDTCLLELPGHLVKGGQFQFLTNLSILVTTIYYLTEVIIMLTKAPRPTVINYFHNLCYNIEFTVTITYWCLVMYWPHLLNGDFNVNLLVDLEIHLFPFIMLSVSRSAYHKVLKSIMYGVVFIYLASYWTGIELTYAGEPYFPYPFLSQEDFYGRFKWLMGFVGVTFFHIYLV